MNIIGQSFSLLTQLGQNASDRASGSAEDRRAQRGSERAARIAQVRAAQDQQTQSLRDRDFAKNLNMQNGAKGTPNRPAQREAVGTQPEKRPEPGQVVNILI